MHSHQRLSIRLHRAARQRQMRRATGLIEIHDGVKFPVRRLDLALSCALDQRLGAAAVVNQISNRADFQVVRLRKHQQIRQPRHAAIVVHDFANHRRRCQACQRRQITARFGVPGAHQHATGLRHHRKNMPRLNNVGRLRIPRHRRLNRARAVGRRNAGRHALRRLDRDGEIGAVFGAIVARHRRQIEQAAPLFGQGHTDQPACVLGHEIDRLGRHELGRHQQIAFVLAVFVIDHHDDAPGFELGDDLGGGTDCPWRGPGLRLARYD